MQKIRLRLWSLFLPRVCLLLLIVCAALPSQAIALTRQASVPSAPRLLSIPIAQPTSQSLLAVLLDRSGSLVDTDPGEYSASIARVLADLWPGKMVIIFFNGTQTPLLQIGPVDLTQNGARDQLKSAIEKQRYNVQGWTPTQVAVEQARDVFAQAGYPAGSQVVMITDGQPRTPADADGTQQIKAIEQQDVPVFSAHQVPINTFGLGNEVGAGAQSFLKQLATTTGGEYHDVTDPAQLAQPVLQLYANWLGMSFVRTTGHNTFSIDTYAGLVDFVAFLQNRNAAPVTLLGPNGQPVPGRNLLDRSLDIHYEFDRLAITDFNPAGRYTIQIADPTARTYVLEQTRLQAEIVSPAPRTPVSVGHPLTVSVALYDQNPRQHVLPHPGDAVVGLKYALTVNGKTVDSGEEVLQQGTGADADLFSAQITPRQAGTLQITIVATYQYIPVLNQPQITLQVTPTPAVVPACTLTNVSCVLQRYGTALGLSLLLFVALLLAFGIWLRPAPFGVFKRTDDTLCVLGSNRSWGRRLLHKSTIYSDELQTIDCPGARFDLHFKSGKQAWLVARKDTASLGIWPALAQEMKAVKVGVPFRLHDGDRLVVNGQPCATFYESSAIARRVVQARSSDSFHREYQ